MHGPKVEHFFPLPVFFEPAAFVAVDGQRENIEAFDGGVGARELFAEHVCFLGVVMPAVGYWPRVA